jgi:uncharacterized protein YecA (UPF0149 family)
MLDLVHDKEDFQDPRESDNQDVTPGENMDQPEISFNAVRNDEEPQAEERPKRKIRIAKPQ